MKIDISAQECKDLIDVLHIAEVVMSSHRREPDVRSANHRALVQKLYGLCRAEGLEHLLGYDERTKRYFPTAEFEQQGEAHTLLDEFAEHVFWDELIGKLSVRDAARIAGGMERLIALDDTARQDLEGPIRQHYVKEFSEHGIRNLAVMEQFGFAGAQPVKTSD